MAKIGHRRSNIYGKGTLIGDTPILASSTTGLQAATYSQLSTFSDALSNTRHQPFGYSQQPLHAAFHQLLYNGDTWDRGRNNEQVTLLALAARGALANSPDQVNYNGKGVFIFVDVTARAGATTLEVKITGKDPVGNDYLDLWVVAADIDTANASFMYVIYPVGAADAAFLTTENVIGLLPRTWRLTVTPNNADVVTYSVAAQTIS